MQAGQVRAAFSWTPLGRSKPTINDFNLTVDAGERILLVGRSGSGKSTVLHAIAGALGTTVAGDVLGWVGVGGGLGYTGRNPAAGMAAERMGGGVRSGQKISGWIGLRSAAESTRPWPRCRCPIRLRIRLPHCPAVSSSDSPSPVCSLFAPTSSCSMSRPRCLMMLLPNKFEIRLSEPWVSGPWSSLSTGLSRGWSAWTAFW
mgnify:CR=1 FL=1